MSSVGGGRRVAGLVRQREKAAGKGAGAHAGAQTDQSVERLAGRAAVDGPREQRDPKLAAGQGDEGMGACREAVGENARILGPLS